MYCSHCGAAVSIGQPVCPQCHQPVPPIVPPVPGFEFQLSSYAGKIRTLGVFWIVYACLSVVLGIAGISFAKHFFDGSFGPQFGPWAHGDMPQAWFFPMAMHFAMLMVVGRAVLFAIAGWGLMEHAAWGRILAIVAAVLSLLKFPFGTALGICTLVILLGYRNSALYEQL
jgi:hypothetical protein